MRERVHLRPRFLFPAILLFAAVATIVIACGGETVVQTVVVEKTTVIEREKVVEKPVEVTKVVQQTVVVVATAQPTATPTAAPTGPTGSVDGAATDIRFGIGTPRFDVQQSYDSKAGVIEPLVMAVWADASKSDLVAKPLLAESWKIDPNLKFMDFKIKKNIKFHDGSIMTAEDVAWSYNDANSRVTKESVHDTAGDLAAAYEEFKVIDADTVRVPFVIYQSHGMLRNLSTFWEAPGVHSKKLFDKLGAEGMRDVNVGTGPLKVVQWTRNDRVILEAFDGYHGTTGMPIIKTVRIFEVPENAARRAMMETGLVAFANPALEDWAGLLKKGFKLAPEGFSGEQIMAFGGNWWEKTSVASGQPLERKVDTSVPYVGNIDDAAQWEKARKVRTALGLDVRREDILKSIYKDQGEVVHVPGWPPSAPGHKKEWAWPFDPTTAKQLMKEAGWENGFKIEWWVGPSDTGVQLVEALCGQWTADLKVTCNIDKQVYGTYRPTIINRTTTKMWLCGTDGVNVPLTWPKGFLLSSVSAGGFMCGTEHRPFGETFIKMANEPDPKKLLELSSGFYDEVRRTAAQIGIVSVSAFPMYNPQIIESWEMLPEGKGSLAGFNNLHRIKLKKK